MGLHFGEATRIFGKTMPFVLLRLAVGFLMGVITVLYFGLVGWVGYTLFDAGSISWWIAAGGLVAAVGLFVYGWKLFSKYVMYMVSAGHIAVIAHVVDTGEVPSNQIEYGKDQVKTNFAEASSLFAVDQVVKSIVKQVTRSVFSFAGMFAVTSGLKKLLELVKRAVNMAASYIDEAILAYVFVSDEENPWRAARDGVVLYGKNWKPILLSTMLIVMALYVALVVAFLAMSPVAGVLGNLSSTFEALGWVVVGGMVFTVYTGFLKPWVKTVVITTFLVEIEDDTPDSDAMDWVAERSDKFQEITRKAAEEETTSGEEKTAVAA